MASGKGPRKKGQPSIKHSCNFAEAKRKLSKISDHEHVEYHPQRHTRPRGSSKLSQMLSRDALISAVDLMWDRSDSTGSPAEQKANKSQLVRVSEKMCYRQSSEARWERDKLYSWMEGVAPSITRLHNGDAEIEKIESCCAEEGHSTPRSPLLEPSSLSILEGDRKDKENEACSSFAKHGHAFAGALAGVSVSLCLHPLDTVKTMIQSCRFQDKSLCYTGRSIISERGGKTFTWDELITVPRCLNPICAQVFLDFIGGLLATLPHQLQSLLFIRSLMNQLRELFSLFSLRSLFLHMSYYSWHAE